MLSLGCRRAVNLFNFLISRVLQLKLLHGPRLHRRFHLLIEVVQLISVSDTQLGQANMSLLLRVDIVPNFGDVLTRQRDSHTLDSGDEFRLSDLAFAPFVHETENFCHVAMLVFHPRQHHRCQLLHIVQLARCLPASRGLIVISTVLCIA